MIDLVEHCRQRSTNASGWRPTRVIRSCAQAPSTLPSDGGRCPIRLGRWTAWSLTCENRDRRTSLIYAPPVPLVHHKRLNRKCLSELVAYGR